MRALALIPARNEAANVGRVVDGAKRYCAEAVVCDDGSEDATFAVAASHGAKVLRHEKRGGKGEAMADLFQYALSRASEFDAVVTIDGDGQHEPEEIPLLLEALKDADIAAGARRKDEVPFARKMTLYNRLTYPGHDSQFGFRAYRMPVLERIAPTEWGYAMDSEILIAARHQGLKVVPVEMSVYYPDAPRKQRWQVWDIYVGILKALAVRRPLLFFGLPGVLSVFTAAYFCLMARFTSLDGVGAFPYVVYDGMVAGGFLLTGLMLLLAGLLVSVLHPTLRQRRSPLPAYGLGVMLSGMGLDASRSFALWSTVYGFWPADLEAFVIGSVLSLITIGWFVAFRALRPSVPLGLGLLLLFSFTMLGEVTIPWTDTPGIFALAALFLIAPVGAVVKA